MFPSVGNAAVEETQLLMAAVRELRDLLPRDWAVSWEPSAGSDQPDGQMLFQAPRGQVLSFATEVKARYRGPATALVHQAASWAEKIGAPALLVVEYANPALRAACEAADVSFVDTTGWVAVDGAGPPGLVIRSQGAQRSPVTRPTSMSRLDGPSAARVVRTLWKFHPRAGFPIGVRELAEQANVAAGTVSKVLPTLESYGAVTRDERGRILGRDRLLLLQRWTQDYNFRTTNRRVGWFLAPRGLRAVDEMIHTIPKDFRISSTGPTAAHHTLTGMGLVPVLPLTTAAYYTQDIAALAGILGVVEAPQPGAANVILAEPRDLTDPDLLPAFGGGPVSVMHAPLPQVLADLTTMGGRYQELSDQILQALPEEEPGR
jgi:DNA-binding MarR family transcriptional regulator